MTSRFTRTELLIGKEALSRIKKSRVAIFGLGAVGSFALEALARTGVGEFILVDFDKVNPSNFNRQLLALESSAGLLKADVAKRRVVDINPYCRVTVHKLFAHKENFPYILSEPPTLVIDAIDSLNPKASLIEYCVANSISVVSSLGAGRKLDPSLVTTDDLSQVTVCPLGRQLKKRLKKRGVGSGVRCVYSTEKPIATSLSSEPESVEYGRGRSRRAVGTIAYMTGIFGLYVAYEAIRFLCDKEGAALFSNQIRPKRLK